MTQTIADILEQIPAEWTADVVDTIRREIADTTIVVLDDDPTGTQTVYDVPVLTEWTRAALEAEFQKNTSFFYILTNSRSLAPVEAQKLATEVGERLRQVAAMTGKRLLVVSRGDSTLRGHYPVEVDALQQALGYTDALTIIAPAFFEGGRYTLEDVHYVRENDTWIPVGDTPYAQDKSFGFHASDLKEYVAEKTQGRIASTQVQSISLELIRQQGPEGVTAFLENCPSNAVCIINALSRKDLQVFCLGMLQAKRKFVCRTAASFVQALAGLTPRPLLQRAELVTDTPGGGLIVVGSHVPKSTAQLNELLTTSIERIEINVTALLANQAAVVNQTIQTIDTLLAQQKDVVVYTSRQLMAGEDETTSLHISVTISECLTHIISRLTQTPRYVIAKGGITSSDVATKGLSVKRALVLGQVLPGVPVWKLGEESKYPGLTYIVFPGNVGSTEAIREVYQALQ